MKLCVGKWGNGAMPPVFDLVQDPWWDSLFRRLPMVTFFIRISVGGYHTCLSRREQGFESPIRNDFVAERSKALC